ncbi:MAG TPA: hypothetical protein VNA25_18150 [Phycisphaerae bacterium]|nr:hypothetical protein [Phycisphaerae bacterium]
MEPYTYDQLKHMTVAQLREIVQSMPDHEGLEGYATMHKDHLLPELCKRLGIHVHHAAAGAAKLRMKASIRKLKAERDAAMSSGDSARAATARREIHALKHKLRRMAAGQA